MLKRKFMLRFIDNVAKTGTSLHRKIKVASKVAVSLSLAKCVGSSEAYTKQMYLLYISSPVF